MSRGGIDKRGDRRYRARYRAPDGRERSRTFERRIDAERWLATQAADVARGAWLDPAAGRLAFETWAERWEAGLSNLRPTTRALNVGVLRNHLLPRFRAYRLTDIATSDVQAMVAEGLEAGASASAVRRRVIVLRTILEAAVAEGRIGRNPAARVTLPTERAREMRFLAPEHIAALADAVRPPHYRPLVLTAAYVGLRWGELAGLRVGNVDVLRRRIAVVEQLVEVGGRLSWGPPKTRAGRRTVTMPATIATMLGEHLGTEPVRSSGLVFPTPSGRPLHRSNFRKVWTRAVRESGIDVPGLTFHELRHTAAALAIAQGAHPLAIRDRLGHASITVTMDVYGGLFPSLDEAIADGLDEVLRDSLAASSRPGAASVARLPTSER